MTEIKKQCFVIMPFSETSDEHTEEYWDKHFNMFLKPAIEKMVSLKLLVPNH